MKKKVKELLAIGLFTIVLFFGMSPSISAEAGFGDFNDYDSGGGDYDGGWDFDTDDYGSSYYFGDDGDSSHNDSGSVSDIAWVIVFMIIVAYAMYGKAKKGSSAGSRPVSTGRRAESKTLPDRTAEISRLIQERDEAFSAPDFISFVKQVYMDIQDAWSKRDLEPVRGILHQNLYQQTQKQIDKKIADGIVNYLERISVNTSYLTAYRRDKDFEYLTVYLAASMIDYQVKEATGEVILGDKTTRWNMNYKMTFMRSKNARTRSAEERDRGLVCPNCGAPLKGTSFGKCEYCDSIVTTGEYDWVLSDFGVIKNDTRDDGIQIGDKE